MTSGKSNQHGNGGVPHKRHLIFSGVENIHEQQSIRTLSQVIMSITRKRVKLEVAGDKERAGDEVVAGREDA